MNDTISCVYSLSFLSSRNRMKASTTESSSSSVSSHNASALPLPFPCFFSSKILTLFPRIFSPQSPCRLIFVVLPLISTTSLSHQVSPSPLLCWPPYHVCSKIFLSFVLKMPRLPRNRYLCQVSTARAMPAVENISRNPSTLSEGRRSSCCLIAVPPNAT